MSASQPNFETRNAPVAGQEEQVTMAIDDFIAYMQADQTVKVTDMLIAVLPCEGVAPLNAEAAAGAKLLQQLYTEMLIERIVEKGLYALLRR